MVRNCLRMTLMVLFAFLLMAQGVSAFVTTYDASLSKMPEEVAPPWEHVINCYTDYPQICDGFNESYIGTTISSPSSSVLVIDSVPLDGFSSRGFYNYFKQECDGPAITPFNPFVIEAKLKVIHSTELDSRASNTSNISLYFSPFPGEVNLLFIEPSEIFLLNSQETVGAKSPIITDDDFHVYRIEVDSNRLIDVYVDGVLRIENYDQYLNRASTKRVVLFGDLTSVEAGRSEWGYVKHNACGSESNINASYMHMLAKDTSGGVLGWGSNFYGTLSDGFEYSNVPVPAYATAIDGSGVALGNMVSVGGAGFYSVALKDDGTVWAWGENKYGQLGRGYTNLNERYAARIAIDGNSNPFDGVMAIASGWEHMLALKEDGTVWAWGGNGDGQLGIGNRTDKLVPVQVPGLDHIVAVSAEGGYHSLALRADGTVYTWGDNQRGQLGLGDFSTDDPDYDNADRLSPTVVINSPADPVDLVVSLGSGHWNSFAILNSGGYYAWGSNWAGQLGLGFFSKLAQNSMVNSPIIQNSPVAESKVISMDGGQQHTLFVLDNGQVWGAGKNINGALGDDIAVNESTPYLFQITGASNVKEVTAEYKYSAALTATGELITWGMNDYGQLGRNTPLAPDPDNYDPVPAQVLGLPVIGH